MKEVSLVLSHKVNENEERIELLLDAIRAEVRYKNKLYHLSSYERIEHKRFRRYHCTYKRSLEDNTI